MFEALDFVGGESSFVYIGQVDHYYIVGGLPPPNLNNPNHLYVQANFVMNIWEEILSLPKNKTKKNKISTIAKLAF